MSRKMLDKVLEGIKPDEAKLRKEVDGFLKQLNSALSKAGLKAEAVVGGSVAKGTFLKDKHDCDVFVRFDYSLKDEDISKMLAKALTGMKAEKVHGSRDYFMIKKRKLVYEIVPVLSISDWTKAVNVTDMSPLHVEWVQKGKMADEIRLAKQFCIASGVYGAESYIRGISGHVLDILVIHYGGFEKMLKAAVGWKDKEVVDPEGVHKGAALKKMNSSKTEGPLIVVDPVMPDRNAAAALSYEKLELFKQKAAEYLKKSDESCFVFKEKTLAEIKKESEGKKLFVLDVEALSGKEDVVGAKLLKAFTLMKNQLRFYDFIVLGGDWRWDKAKKAMFWVAVDPNELLPVNKWIGPPLKAKVNVDEFKEKHAETFVEDGRICTYVKRKYIKPEQLVKDVLKDKLFKEKVGKVTLKT